MSLLQEALDACAALTKRVEHLEYDKVAQALEITKLKRRVKKLEKRNKARVLKLRRLQKVGTSQRVDTSDDTVMDDESNQGRMIAEMDKDDAVILMDEKEEDKKVEEAKVVENESEPAEVQEVVDVVTTAKLITKVVSAASATIPTIEPNVPAATLTAAPARVAAAPSRRRKGVITRDPKEESTTSKIIPAETKSKDKEKAAKRRKLNKEVKDLKKHLEILPDEDDDVYTEATPLARKVLIVDYEIIELNNKPYYKIIRADGTHQLYISFLTLLKNFDREDLEALWNLVKKRFSTSKPKNFSDDFLLTTLGAMFEKPDALAQVWKNQRTINGQELEATRIMWCAYHNLYNHSADFVSRKKVPTLKVYSRPDAECCKTLGRRGKLEEKHTKCLMLLVKNLMLSSKVDAVG
uniref:Uncharacterized protein n=1 Tax=Tanacetum cinerariifolium TaxID=118510 RepID=A0A6L2JET0_TANCI|nr:hypothetical protein [Tanacetum cinerariifolium]